MEATEKARSLSSVERGAVREGSEGGKVLDIFFF